MIPGNFRSARVGQCVPLMLDTKSAIFFRNHFFLYTCFSLTQYAKLNRDDWLYIEFCCSDYTACFEGTTRFQQASIFSRGI